MATISYSKRPGKYRKISGFLNIVCICIPKFLCIETDRVLFINRFTIHYRFNRFTVVIALHFIPNFFIPAMTGLEHIEVKPVCHDETRCWKSLFALGCGWKVINAFNDPPTPASTPFAKRSPNIYILFISRVAISTHYPHYIVLCCETWNQSICHIDTRWYH